MGAMCKMRWGNVQHALWLHGFAQGRRLGTFELNTENRIEGYSVLGLAARGLLLQQTAWFSSEPNLFTYWLVLEPA